jgi:hypothetical protein
LVENGIFENILVIEIYLYDEKRLQIFLILYLIEKIEFEIIDDKIII